MERNIYKIENNLYVTSDEEFIEEGDYGIDLDDNSLFKCKSKYGEEFTSELLKNGNLRGLSDYDNCKKIILTTDPTLITDGVQSIDDTFLQWFIDNFKCEFVEVEKTYKNWYVSGTLAPDLKLIYKIIIPQEEPKYVSSGGAKYVFGTVKGEYTIGNPSPNTVKGEFALAMGYNPETTNRAEGHHSIVIGNGLRSTEPYQLLVDRNGIKIDKIMTIEEYELLSQVLKSINDIKF